MVSGTPVFDSNWILLKSPRRYFVTDVYSMLSSKVWRVGKFARLLNFEGCTLFWYSRTIIKDIFFVFLINAGNLYGQ